MVANALRNNYYKKHEQKNLGIINQNYKAQKLDESTCRKYCLEWIYNSPGYYKTLVALKELIRHKWKK